MVRTLGITGMLWAATTVPAWPQAPSAATLLAGAQEQYQIRRLDSAAVLLRRVVDSASGATPTERLSAWVRLGVVQFYLMDSSGAAASFRAALAIDTGLQVDGLERIDPMLGAMLAVERAGRAGLPDGVFLAAAIQEPPQLQAAPPLQYPPAMRQRRLQGTVTVEAVIDTGGRPEPESVRVVESPDSGFDESAKALLRGSRFSVGRSDGRAVRVLVRLPVDFELTPVDSTPIQLGAPDTVYNLSQRVPREVRPPRLLGSLGRLDFQPRPGDRVADFGLVVLHAIVDTFGLIAPGTARIVSTTMPDWVAEAVLQQFRNARFEPARADGRKVRALIRQSVRVRFGGRGRTR